MERKDFVFICTASAAAIAAFVVFVFAFAAFGGDIVFGLDQKVGETVAYQARAYENAGRTQDAIQLYRQAFTVPFDDAGQRYYARRDLADLLLKEELWESAEEQYRRCVEERPNDFKLHSRLATALRQQGKYADLVEFTKRWRAIAAEHDDTGQEAVALYWQGLAYEEEGVLGAALNIYLEGHQTDPTQMNAFHAAKILYEQGNHIRAAELAREYLEHGSGWRANQAKDLLKSIEGAA